MSGHDVQNERPVQNHSKRDNEMEIINVPHRKFKIIVIKIITGLKKRLEDLTESFNIEKNVKKKKRTN